MDTFVPYADAKRTVLDYLTVTREVSGRMRKPEHAPIPYTGIADVVLRHGRAFLPGPRKLPYRLRRRAMKQCFTNSQRVLLEFPQHELTYVEGYALSIIPVHHGWLVDREGTVVDVTWREPGAVYIGVPFRRDYVIETVRRSQHWTALLDNWTYDPPQPIITGAHPVDQWLEPFTHGEPL